MAKAKFLTIDPDCWGRLKKGDPAALGELYDVYVDKLFLVATGLTDQRELARDALQEVFIELWKYRESLGDIQYPLAYLSKVLRSILIRKLKKEFPKKHLPVEEALLHLEDRENHSIGFDDGSEITTRLNHAISSLTTRQKLIIRLHYYEGLSYEQIAEKLRMNYQSVNNLAFRTIRHLRTLMTSLF
ncbi:MAG TPA: sigma-70 family RNA polymerase sigma factor [Puia sp.]|nr:sigma-70 family RNA polymerase sigma factor [Puia sp.]